MLQFNCNGQKFDADVINAEAAQYATGASYSIEKMLRRNYFKVQADACDYSLNYPVPVAIYTRPARLFSSTASEEYSFAELAPALQAGYQVVAVWDKGLRYSIWAWNAKAHDDMMSELEREYQEREMARFDADEAKVQAWLNSPEYRELCDEVACEADDEEFETASFGANYEEF